MALRVRRSESTAWRWTRQLWPLTLIQRSGAIIGFAFPTGTGVENVVQGQLSARAVDGTFESNRVPVWATARENDIEPAHGELKIGVPKTRRAQVDGTG